MREDRLPQWPWGLFRMDDQLGGVASSRARGAVVPGGIS